MAKLDINLPLGIYQHYKGQKYRVLHLAQHSETEELLVVYQALYGDFGIWVRPYSMFVETVELDDSASQKNKTRRFSLIAPTSETESS